MLKKLITALIIIAMCIPSYISVYAMPADASAYCDVNFDNEADTNTTWTNTADSDYVFAYSSAASYFPPVQTLVADPVKGNNVLNLTAEPSMGAPGHYFCLGSMSVGATMIVPGEVRWFELSFKFNEGFTKIYMNTGEYPFEISADGSLYIAGLNGNSFYSGVRVTNLKLEVGEWYHLVIAVDNIDKVGNESRFYAWANGKFLETAETPYHGSTCTKAYNSDPGHCLLFGILGNEKVDFCIDDFKIYTTYEPVRTSGEFCFDPMDIYAGSEITSDIFKIDGDKIYVPEDETAGELFEYIREGDNGILLMDGDEIVPEEEYAMTSALGKSIIARSDSGIGIRKYQLEQGDRLFGYYSNGTIWKKPDETIVTDVSSLTKGDSVGLRLMMKNDTAYPRDCLIVVAAYNGTALAGVALKEETVPVGGGFATSEFVTINNTENLSLTAYVWNGIDDYTPCATRINLNR